MSVPPPPAAPPPPPEGYQYGTTGVARTEGKAIASLVCGIVGFIILGVVLGVVAIVLGVRARRVIAASAGALKGAGLAMAGIVLGVVDIIVGIYIAAVFMNA
jgi:Domain of unknown function (DUF4190)